MIKMDLPDQAFGLVVVIEVGVDIVSPVVVVVGLILLGFASGVPDARVRECLWSCSL